MQIQIQAREASCQTGGGPESSYQNAKIASVVHGRSKERDKLAYLGIKDEHFLRGKAEVHIEFEELFQLFNQDVIDKSIVSAYCL